MANRQGSEVKERYSIRLEPSVQKELVETFGTLQGAIDWFLKLNIEKSIHLAEEYAMEHVMEKLPADDVKRIKNGQKPKSDLYWDILGGFRDGYRTAKGHPWNDTIFTPFDDFSLRSREQEKKAKLEEESQKKKQRKKK